MCAFFFFFCLSFSLVQFAWISRMVPTTLYFTSTPYTFLLLWLNFYSCPYSSLPSTLPLSLSSSLPPSCRKTPLTPEPPLPPPRRLKAGHSLLLPLLPLFSSSFSSYPSFFSSSSSISTRSFHIVCCMIIDGFIGVFAFVWFSSCFCLPHFPPLKCSG